MKYIVGKCVGLSSEGKGIIKNNGQIVFVDSLLLGEEAEVEITFESKGVCFGKIKKLLSFSKYRIIPLCPISTACGGCVFQNATYQYELIYKRNKVKEDLLRIGHIDVYVKPTLGMEKPEYYRNKIQVPFGKVKKDIIYGFYRSNTHNIIPFTTCYIQDEESNIILKQFSKVMKELQIDPYDEDKKEGIIRHVLIRTSSLNEIMVVIITNGSFFPKSNKFIKLLLKNCPQISTIIQNMNARDTNVILGDSEKILYGKGYINEQILNLKFKVSAKSFFQVNKVQTEVLYATALKLANLSKQDEVLDAYAGVATIGLLAASKCKHVTSVELEHSAVLNGRSSAKINSIDNIDIVEDDCTRYIKKYMPKFDVVIMDPPRKGSTKEFLEALCSISPKKIIYISCDPSTLSRDLSLLVKKYSIKSVQPVDMFPRTHHVESVVLLQRK